MKGSLIQNSVIHQGKGHGVSIKNSYSIQLVNNAIVDFVQHGLKVTNSHDILIDENWLFYVRPEADEEPKMFYYPEDPEGFGAFTLSEGNHGMTVTNNIAAGSWHHGFHFVPNKCEENNPDFIF